MPAIGRYARSRSPPSPRRRRPRLQSTHMRDTRYCEIFTVFLSPSPIAKVNNTYGPEQLPAGLVGLARHRRARRRDRRRPRPPQRPALLADGQGQGHRSRPDLEFAGKQLREVATIDLTKVGLAPPPAFTPGQDHPRHQVHLPRDKRVFELVDPERPRLRDAGLVADRRSGPELRGAARPRASGRPARRLDVPVPQARRRTSSCAPTARRRSSRTSSRTPTSGSPCVSE